MLLLIGSGSIAIAMAAPEHEPVEGGGEGEKGGRELEYILPWSGVRRLDGSRGHSATQKCYVDESVCVCARDAGSGKGSEEGRKAGKKEEREGRGGEGAGSGTHGTGARADADWRDGGWGLMYVYVEAQA